jgi:drug/metabolite transporter (DMT)-like permease
MRISHPASRAVEGETPVSTALGAMWALLTVVIWSAWPSCTRLSITKTLSPQDLVALRYAIGGLLFLPILIHGAHRISPRGWREGLTLAFLQGAPLAMLVTLGLRFAPAGHMAALSPGLLPLFAASVGYVVSLRRRPPCSVTGFRRSMWL